MKKLLQLSLALLTLAAASKFGIAQDSSQTATPVATPAAAAASAPMTVETAPPKINSLIKIDELIGTGTDATPGLYLDVHYTGWLYDPKAPDRRGAKFDSSRDGGKPLTFQLDARNVIRGWDLGVKGMKVGGKRILIIPAYLAYGSKGTSAIPANSALIFDIELLSAR